MCMGTKFIKSKHTGKIYLSAIFEDGSLNFWDYSMISSNRFNPLLSLSFSSDPRMFSFLVLFCISLKFLFKI